ncbi:MAG: hypothetical protein DBX59_02320 [Bacillota bacterium]|nr:MAG: hypothetical protein DBX59_02320 [Bacillota bacterium]
MKKRLFRIVNGIIAVALALCLGACSPQPAAPDKKPAGQYTPEDFRYTPSVENAALETDRYSVWSAYTTDKITRHAENEVKFRELYIEAARGETESAQLILTARGDVREYTLAVSDLVCGETTLPASLVEVSVQHYIKTTRPSSPAYPADWYPDALIPYDKIVEYDENSIEIAQGKTMQNQGFWFDIAVPDTAAAGLYEGKVTLAADGKNFEVPLKLRVFDFTLNKTMHAKSAFGLWRWMFDSVYGDKCDVDALEDAYYEFLLKYKVNADWIPGTKTGRGLSQEHNYVSPEEFAPLAYEYAKREEVNCYEVPAPWSGANINVSRLRAYLTEMAETVIKDGRVEFNIFDKAFLYTVDEPSRDKFPMVKKMAEDVRALKKTLADELLTKYANVEGIEGLAQSLMKMTNVVTIAMYDELKGVETWCPMFSSYGSGDENGDYFRRSFEAQLEGEETWWYGCVAPKYPYVNYHTDNSNVGMRVLGWQQNDYGITGNVYWCTNVFMKWNGHAEGYVDRDVWTDPDSFPGEGNQVNGDGYLLYPGNKYGMGNDPIATIRLTAARDAQEDYEYLYQLEQLLNAANERYGTAVTLEELLGDIYDTLYKGVIPVDEPDLVFRARRQVASMLEALSGDAEAFMVANASGTQDEMTRVRVYAPSGASVTVNGVKAESKNGGYVAYIMPEQKEDNVIEAKVESNGKTTVIYGTAAGRRKVIDALETNGWSQEEVQTDLTDTAYEGEKAVSFTVYGNPDVLSVNSYLTLQNGDFTGYDAVEFYAYNPTNSIVSFSLNLVDDKGVDYTGTKVVLRPERWTKVTIAIPEMGSTNFAAIQKLRVRLSPPAGDEPVTFLIDNITGVLKGN